MAFATLNGANIVSGTLVVPLVGMWTADIAIATGAAETGAATIVLGNLTLAGTIYRADPFAGQTRARIVGGAGGWRQPIASQSYGLQSGIQLSSVLEDAASLVGETVNVPNDVVIGPFYVRPADLASFTLRQFCPAWYIDTAGVTQIASWPVTVVGSSFLVTSQRPDEGMVEIATEDYASWLPGASFTAPNLEGAFQSAGTVFAFASDGTFRLQVLTDTAVDRVLGPLHAIIDQRVSPLRFFGEYRYQITNVGNGTVDATPIDSSIGLPAINGLPLDSDSISTYVPPSGVECRVVFGDGRPTYPRVAWTAGQSTSVSLSTGADYVALAGLVKDDLTILASAAAATPAGPSEPGFKAFAAALVSANFPLPVAASNVKAT
jgi:hypothetical protein